MSISDDSTKRRIAIILFIAGGAALAAALIFFNVMKNDASTYRKMIMKATDKTPDQLDPEPAPSSGAVAAESDNAEFAGWADEVAGVFAVEKENIITGAGEYSGTYPDGAVSKAAEWKTELDKYTYEDLSAGQQLTYDLLSHFLENAQIKGENDKEKYAAILEQKLGAKKNILNYNEMLEAYIEKIFSESDEIMKENKSAKKALRKYAYPEGTYEELVKYIQDRAGDSFVTTDIPDYSIEETQDTFKNDERYSYASITPGSEGYNFTINKTVADERKDLYTAVARDIYPGTIYMETHRDNTVADRYLVPDGVRDGVASYAEFAAYDLIDGDDRSIINLKRNNSRSILLLCGKADLMLNYFGSTQDEVKNFLTGYGVSDEDARNRIFSHIESAPGDYAARALGYVQVLDMQRKAKDLKGEAYSDKAFYKFLVNYGYLPFDAMEKRLYLM